MAEVTAYAAGTDRPMGEYASTHNVSDEDKAEMERLCKKHEKLEADRTQWETHWQEVMDYIVPRKAEINTTRTPGDKRGNELYDSTAIQANELLSSFLHSMLTSLTTRFFDLVPEDATFAEDDEVKEYLQECADRMYRLLNSSNFQTEVHEIYIDQGSIGTACLYEGEHPTNHIHFSARSMKEIFVEENNLGLIDTVNRKFSWKPRQIVQEFGEDKLHPWVVEQYKKGCDDPWEIIHTVEPSMEKGIHKFKSRYFLKEHRLFLDKKGFHEFPYMVPRWTKVSGEVYGRGPGMQCLPEVKMINKMEEAVIRGAQKTVDPPMMVSDDGVIGRVRLTPGGLTVVRPFSEVPIRPLITDARIDFGIQMTEMTRQRIRAAFYVDQLQLSQGPQMTATEVNQRTEEKLRLMGPVLGRQHFEFLAPLIDRTWGIMERKGLLPSPPPKFAGRKINVQYSSMIARAQRMSEGQNLTRAIAVAAPIAQAKPDVLDNLSGDKAFRYIMDIYGVPQKIMESTRDIQKMRQGRAEAQQAAMERDQEMHEADVASKTLPGAAQMQQAQAAQE